MTMDMQLKVAVFQCFSDFFLWPSYNSFSAGVGTLAVVEWSEDRCPGLQCFCTAFSQIAICRYLQPQRREWVCCAMTLPLRLCGECAGK